MFTLKCNNRILSLAAHLLFSLASKYIDNSYYQKLIFIISTTFASFLLFPDAEYVSGGTVDETESADETDTSEDAEGETTEEESSSSEETTGQESSTAGEDVEGKDIIEIEKTLPIKSNCRDTIGIIEISKVECIKKLFDEDQTTLFFN